MIQETLNHRNHAILTSDCWHVLRARWMGESPEGAGKPSEEPLYQRTIVSEHEDRDSAVNAARGIVARFVEEMVGRTRETRDHVLVRRPGHKSLKISPRTGPARP